MDVAAAVDYCYQCHLTNYQSMVLSAGAAIN
jgi:hypothetical protein